MSHARFIFLCSIAYLLFSCSPKENLPTIIIEELEPINWVEKVPCIIHYVNKNDTVKLDATIRMRGGFSSRFYKRSYRLELNEHYGLCDLPTDDDWILNANYIDKTFMRHKMSYDLYREMHENNVASRCAYFNLRLDDEYKGLYVLMEKINASMIGLNKKDTMAMLFKDPPVFIEGRLDYVQDTTNYYHQKYPKKYRDDKTYYIERFRNFLFNTDDKTFADSIAYWVDIDNIVDWHLLILFSNNGDGVLKNFFLYKINSNTPFRIALWDYDHSFGREGDNEMNMLERGTLWERSILFSRLMDNEYLTYYDKMKKRWAELRKNNIFSVDNIKNHINHNNNLIRNDVEENFKRWPHDDKWYFDDNSYEDELKLMIDFVQIIIPHLDDYFNFQ